ncbi:MAG: glycoside hydrolase family 20 zincin-like fold domain-containing protein [Acidimicrobiales bacterium]
MRPDPSQAATSKVNLLPRPRFADLGGELVPDRIVAERIDSALPAQGYELRIGAEGVVLVAGDEQGAFYGRATLRQLSRLHGGSVPAGVIRDHPDLAVRAVMLDVSRDKVPTMATLKSLVERLASWKMNQVQLYMEHTFAYSRHPEVHAAASPFTAEEVLDLDEFCAAHHVELVPNQACLGHMERWLRDESFRGLALEPEGFVDPFGIRRPPMTLDPDDPESLSLVRGMMAELLPLFRSRRVHVGLDEAWEIPRERVGDFLRWASLLRSLPELDGREMLMWGDMVAADAALLARLPDDVTVCEWGYEAAHPFDARAGILAAAGRRFWVAPGTSSWLGILGRITNARQNCRSAAQAAIDHGATGYLIADWGDRGHLQQLPISEPAFAYAAAVSWCLKANADLDLGAALSAHAFEDSTGELAAALLELGDAHLAVTPQVPNMSSIAMHLYFPQLTAGRGPTSGLAASELDDLEGRLDAARARLRRADPRRADGPQVLDELDWSAKLVAVLSDDMRARLAGNGTLAAVSEATRRALARRLEALTERHRALWNARNRPGGLADSQAWLEHLRAAYETGRPDPQWAGLTVTT